MPLIQFARSNTQHIDRPICKHCGSRMWLARVAPGRKGGERRTFECPVCEIASPTKNEASIVGSKKVNSPNETNEPSG